MTRRGEYFLAWILAMSMVGGNFGCNHQQPQQARTSDEKKQTGLTSTIWPPDERRLDVYVGSHVCRDCHADLWDAYQAHPMNRTMRAATDSSVQAIEFDGSFERAGFRYESKLENGRLFHAESAHTRTGEPLFRQRVPVDFAVGSGRRGITFLTNREGLLFQSPLTWYADAADWDLSPGYQPGRHPRFERRISSGCIACHSGLSNPTEGGFHRFQTDAVFREMGIACERCHGPGKEHVDYHTATTSVGTDPLLRHRSFSPAQRESICYQCHLHGVERVLRVDRTEFDFRPGDLVTDIWVVFTHGSGVDEAGQTLAVSQVEQLIESVCFVESDGRLGCTSCHDPHRIPTPAERIDFYRSRCLECHTAPAIVCSVPLNQRQTMTSEDSCIQCHMPSLDAGNVPHTSQTDHRILKSNTRGSAWPATQDQLELFQESTFPVPVEAAQRAFGLSMGQQAGSRRQMRALSLQALLNLSRPYVDATVSDVVSSGLLQTDPDKAVSIAQKALETNPQNESLIETMAIYYEQKGQDADSLNFIERFLHLNPNHSLMLERKARVLLGLDQPGKALSAVQRAITCDPQRISSRELLIRIAKRLELFDLVRREEQMINQLKQIRVQSSGSR